MRILVALLSLLLATVALAAPPPVIVLTVNGAIGPSTADYFHRGLDRAVKEGAQLVVLQMDTPGGLDTSMRAIIKDILASPIPVASFVAPSGARAASAGTYILYASHIAAMAPATNLGAATPVRVGGPGAEPERAPKGGKPGGEAKSRPRDEGDPEPGDAMERKVRNDASAYIRGLAQLRGRNADWAEQAVRSAVSLPAEEAVKIKVADLIAADLPDLLKKIDGRNFDLQGAKQVLHTEGAALVSYEPDWRSRLLAVITDPSIAYVLMLLGIYGLLFELYNPGLVLPGVIGGICLIVALYAMHTLPINYAGLGLILLGIVFLVAELFVTSYGALGVGGVIAFVLGSVMLIDTDVPGYAVPWTLVAPLAAVTALFLLVMVGMALKSRKRPVVSGREELIGAHGEIIEHTDGIWWARVHSENWEVRSHAHLHRGQRVRVTSIEGLVLHVVPVGGEA